MQNIVGKISRALIPAVVAVFAAGVLADPPAWAGEGKHGKGKDKEHKARPAERGGGDINVSVHFRPEQRTIVHEYYTEQFRTGRCPPGLAKKNNGCMPPGQAKKWAVGRPLPRDVVYYDLPPAVVVKIGTPPPGYRYVRVATDILLIAIGTAMVVDAIEDLGRM